MSAEETKELEFDGDNGWYVRNNIIPHLRLAIPDRLTMWQVYSTEKDEDGKTFEQRSDGETGVPDLFLDGKIKSPDGVTHDYLNRVVHEDGTKHKTPDGKVWTKRETNAIYRRIKKALGSSFRHRWHRWLGVTVSGFLPKWAGGWWR